MAYSCAKPISSRLWAMLTICCLLSTGYACVKAMTQLPREQQEAVVVPTIQRDNRLLAYLPTHLQLGYLSDTETLANPNPISRYYLMQYVIAPRVVVRSTHYPWVIGDFADPTHAQPAIKAAGLRVERALGNSLFLLRHP